MKYCLYCKEPNQDEALVCHACGRHLDPDVIEGTYTQFVPYKKAGGFIRILFFSILILFAGLLAVYLWPSTVNNSNKNTKQGPVVIYSTYIGRTPVITQTVTPIVLNLTARRLWAFLNSQNIPLSQTIDDSGNISLTGRSLDGTLAIMATFNGEALINSRFEMKITSDSVTNSHNYKLFDGYHPILLPDWSGRDDWIDLAGKDNNLKLKYGQDPAQFSTVIDNYKITLISSKIKQTLVLIINRV